jgi:chemosensory pili system protein ChpE
MADGNLPVALFFGAFGMGLAFCGPPGLVFVEAFRRGAARGFSAALTVEFGSLIGDAVWAVVGLTGAALLLQVEAVRGIFAAAGVVLLAWLGLRALRDGWTRPAPGVVAIPARGDFAVGAAISLTSPQSVAYWIALGGVIETMIGRTPAISDLMVFFAGFMLACLAYCFLIAGLIVGAQKLLTPTLHRVVNAACGLVLIGFAMILGREGLRLLP